MVLWFQTWAAGCTVMFSNKIKNQRENKLEDVKSLIFDMLSFRCLREIQMDVTRRRLAVWVGQEKKKLGMEGCFSEVMETEDLPRRECEK